ncbi:MAG: substrate-binding domain-containing protein [Anaerolineae bacterium]|nr:substrate-binding domain-containing protein [Anaerolineae bacterium]
MTGQISSLVRRFAIPIYLVLILGVLLLAYLLRAVPGDIKQVNCFIGSEKNGFLDNQKVKDILKNKYDLEVAYTRMGSIEQAYADSSQMDCLWPSNTSALEIYRDEHKSEFDSGSTKFDTIFNSPIVLYSWQPVVDALLQQGLVEQINTIYYTTDTPKLLGMLVEDPPKSWADLGVPDLYGNFNIFTTDPTRSNSGNMFYALFANMLVGGQVATVDSLKSQLPIIKAYFDNQGYMEESSGILFSNYINTGMGKNPIIANYESLLIEFSVAHQDSLDLIRDNLRVIYPVPTVWSAHPLIARTANGKLLLDALKDADLQEIAWAEHGFRSGLAGAKNDPNLLAITGVPADVNSIIPLPRTDAMLDMLDYLRG